MPGLARVAPGSALTAVVFLSWSFFWPLAIGPLSEAVSAAAPEASAAPELTESVLAGRALPQAYSELVRREARLKMRLEELATFRAAGPAPFRSDLRAPFVRQVALAALEQQAIADSLERLQGQPAPLTVGELREVMSEQEQLVELLAASRAAILAAEAALQGSSGADEGEERLKLLAELAATKAELAEERLRSAELSARLGQRTRQEGRSLAGLLKLVGLDLEDLLAEAAARDKGRGDPSPEAVRRAVLQEVALSLPLAAPLASYRVTSRFGEERSTGEEGVALHYGLDMAAPSGAVVRSAGDGKITYAGWRGAYGRLVEVEHEHGVRTRYGHLKSIAVKVGQKVKRGASLGEVGSSGRSTGPHLHYEVLYRGRPLDPERFLGAGRRLQETAELGLVN